VFVCMYCVCMYVCMCMYVCVRMYVLCMYVCMYVCMHVKWSFFLSHIMKLEYSRQTFERYSSAKF